MTEKIQQIASLTRDYNFHSHTQFCDGHAPMEVMAEAACRAGMRHYAFTPHSPIDIPSPCNMSYADVDLFLREVGRLQRIYGDRIRLYSGMEIDYISPSMGPHLPWFRDLDLDLRIGSVHFVPDRKGNPVDCDGRPERFCRYLNERFGGDLRYVIEKFYAQTAEMIARGGFDIVGHIDKIGNNASHACPGVEEEAWYVDLVESVIDEAIASGVAIELNTKHFGTFGRFFPDPRRWERLRRAGVRLIVNSDAHDPEKIRAGRDEAFRRLAEAGCSVPE